MAHAIMEDKLGRTRKAPLGFSWLTLLFGFLVPLLRGHWTQALVSLLLSAVTYGIYWLIYPFFVNYFYRKHLYNNGFRPIGVVGISEDDYEERTGWPLVHSIDQREPIRPRSSERQSTASAKASSGEKAGFLKKYWGWLFIAAFAFLLILESQREYEAQLTEEARVAELRKKDPATYLAEIKDTLIYMEELKELDPEKYRATLDAQWDTLYSKGRGNSVDYVERLYQTVIVPDEKLIFALQWQNISEREFQRAMMQNQLYSRTLSYAKDAIRSGQLDVLIERGVIFYFSAVCETKPGYKALRVADRTDVADWPLIEELDRNYNQYGYDAFAGSVYLGAWVPFNRKTLAFPFVIDVQDRSPECAEYRHLVTHNRFYDRWDVESPELLASDY